MNQLTSRGLANAIWSTLTGYFPNNMVVLYQDYTYYEVRVYVENGEIDEQVLLDKVPCKDLDNVRLSTDYINEDKDWCLYIFVYFER